MNRREFLQVLSGLAVLPVCSTMSCTSEIGAADLLSASQGIDGNYYCSRITTLGKILWSRRLDWRAHAVTISPRGEELVIMGRRPGRQFLVLSLESGELVSKIDASAQRHFYGHCVFAPDGSRFFTTENCFVETEQSEVPVLESVIGIYDPDNSYQRIGEIPSHGVGAHELALCSDGKTLVVANGGIYTHPDFGRDKLNSNNMKPSLVFVDKDSGKKKESYVLEDAQLSIRHLSVLGDEVYLGMQYEGDQSQEIALLNVLSSTSEMRQFAAPRGGYRVLNQYIGSVASSKKHNTIAATSPRGNRIELWDRKGGHLASVEMHDVSGLAPSPDGDHYYLSSSSGEIAVLDAANGTVLQSSMFSQHRWDNHMTAIPPASF